MKSNPSPPNKFCYCCGGGADGIDVFGNPPSPKFWGIPKEDDYGYADDDAKFIEFPNRSAKSSDFLGGCCCC